MIGIVWRGRPEHGKVINGIDTGEPGPSIWTASGSQAAKTVLSPQHPPFRAEVKVSIEPK